MFQLFSRHVFGFLFAACIHAIACLETTWAQPLVERDPINYSSAPTDDPVTRLQQQIDDGQIRLDYDPKLGYLPSVLKALGIPTESQMLVFSKTSLQPYRKTQS